MKAMFVSPWQVDPILFERRPSQSSLLRLELPGETSQTVPDASLVLSNRAETARGVVQLGPKPCSQRLR